MIYYMAGLSQEKKKEFRLRLPIQGVAYEGFVRTGNWWFRVVDEEERGKWIMGNEMRIFVDSGAPSLYNKLARLDKGAGHMGSFFGDRKHDDFSWTENDEFKVYFDEYIKFIKKYIRYIDHYANLDIINNPELTWKNQQYMEAQGLSPIPVFHLGSDEKWLKMYLEKGYKYIALGGMIPNPPSVLIPILDALWDKYLTYGNGMPIVKVHGFAVTSTKLIARYPWYSVDSTSWVKFGKYGIVCVPKRRNGVWVYDETAWNVVVSNRSPSLKVEGKHLLTFTPAERDLILQYFEEKGYKMGKSEFREVEAGYKLQENERWAVKDKEVELIVEPGLSNDYRKRDELNIKYYLDLEASVPEWPWPFKKPHEVEGFFKI